MSRRSLPLLLSLLLAVVLLGGALVAQVPYVALGPGPTFNTLGDDAGKPVISVQERQVYPDTGHLDATTVGVRGQLTLAEALVDWVRRDRAVVPRELVFPPGKTDEQVNAQNAQEMTASQDSATTAALAQLGIAMTVAVSSVSPGSAADGTLQKGDVLTGVDGAAVTGPAQLRALVSDRTPGQPVRIGYRRGSETRTVTLTTKAAPDAPQRALIGVATSVTYPFPITIGLKDVGGPSAGLMFALGLVDKLEPGSLTGGRYIAGTGEITPEGVVQPIGGIQQKLLGARGKGATVFLVPAENCRDAVANRPDGLQLVKVSSLSGAVQALEAVRDGGTAPSCAA